MAKYRVFGKKMLDYYVVVSAKDPVEAARKANNLDSEKWSQVENDDVIEAVDVIEDEYRSR